MTLVAGLIGTIIAATGIIFKFQSFLSFLGIAVPAIAGIMWCEYYFIQGRTYKHREGINWIAVISWLIGFAASYYSSNKFLNTSDKWNCSEYGYLLYINEMFWNQR